MSVTVFLNQEEEPEDEYIPVGFVAVSVLHLTLENRQLKEAASSAHACRPKHPRLRPLQNNQISRKMEKR